MNGNVGSKQLIISSITAIVCGVIFIIIVPILALFVFDVLISAASLFDPLHQGKNIEQVWDAFIGIIILQIIFSLLASIATGVSISFLTAKLESGWVYLFGMVVSLCIYCVFQFISLVFVGIFASELVVISWALVSLAIVGVTSIIIGLTCVGVNKKISVKNP